MYPDPDRPRKFGLIDLLVIVAALAGCVYLWQHVSEVLVYRWDWNFLPQVLWKKEPGAVFGQPNVLLEGLLTTLRLSLWSMLLACLLGLLLGIFATFSRLLPRLTSIAYVALIRNIPPLVFMFVFYFFISSQLIPALGIDTWARNLEPTGKGIMNLILGPPEILENLISGVICLALFEAAYIAEIVRAGLLSVPRGQSEAAHTVGLGQFQTFIYVLLPQALRSVAPPMANQFILLIKNSAIVSLISVQELTFMGTEIAVSTNRRFETWIVVALMYFVLCYGLASLFSHYEKRARLRAAQ